MQNIVIFSLIVKRIFPSFLQENQGMEHVVAVACFFYKHKVYKHTEAQILGSQNGKPTKKLSIWLKLFLKGSFDQEKYFKHIFRGRGGTNYWKLNLKFENKHILRASDWKTLCLYKKHVSDMTEAFLTLSNHPSHSQVAAAMPLIGSCKMMFTPWSGVNCLKLHQL